MEAGILKTFAQTAGIGGIALGVLLFVFRDIIRKNIFPKFKDEALAYRLLRLMVILVWTIAVLGIFGWMTATTRASGGDIVISKKEFLGDLHFANVQVVINQYQEIKGQALDEKTKQEIERATNLVKTGDYTEAIRILKKATGNATIPALYNNLGVLYSATDNLEQARQSYLKAVEKAPDDRRAQSNLGVLEARAGNTEAAMQHLAKADTKEANALIKRLQEEYETKASESEPNNDNHHPNEIEVDQWIEAAITKNDSDFFQFKTPPTYRDRVSAEVENKTNTLMPKITLFDSNRHALGASSSIITHGQEVKYPWVSEPDHTYFVGIDGGNSEGPYRFKVKTMKAYDSAEPNDEPGTDTATPLALGTMIQANILDGADTDCFAISSTNTNLRAFVKNNSKNKPKLSPRIVVYDEDRKMISASSSISTPGQDLKYPFKIKAGAPYYVCVGTLQGDGAYELTVTEDSTPSE